MTARFNQAPRLWRQGSPSVQAQRMQLRTHCRPDDPRTAQSYCKVRGRRPYACPGRAASGDRMRPVALPHMCGGRCGRGTSASPALRGPAAPASVPPGRCGAAAASTPMEPEGARWPGVAASTRVGGRRRATGPSVSPRCDMRLCARAAPASPADRPRQS